MLDLIFPSFCQQSALEGANSPQIGKIKFTQSPGLQTT